MHHTSHTMTTPMLFTLIHSYTMNRGIHIHEQKSIKRVEECTLESKATPLHEGTDFSGK